MKLQKAGWYTCRLVLLLVLLMTGVRDVRAQMMPVGDPMEEYARVLQLAGKLPAFSFNVRPLPSGFLLRDVGEGHPWENWVKEYAFPEAQTGWTWRVLEPWFQASSNSDRPSGQNDGAVWQGRGVTLATSAGVVGQRGIFTVAVRPLIFYAQNSDFDLSQFSGANGYEPYTYFIWATGTPIDLPQRYGEMPLVGIDPGQSYARLDWQGVAAGISTENMWWGPATENAIVMSNHAGGFPHAFLGTSGPANVGIGRLNLRWVWGWLYESGYFDYNEENDRRYFTGAALDFSPVFAPGLSIGLARSFVQNTHPDEPGTEDLFSVFDPIFREPKPNEEGEMVYDPREQVFSLFARWVMPASGLEVYGEWAKGDYNINWRDFVMEPDHARGYTIGFQKLFDLERNQLLRFKAEHTILEGTKTLQLRSFNSSFFYAYPAVVQGYTHRGQVLGAGIGPGGISYLAGLDLFAPWGMSGLFLQRVTYDNDRYWRMMGDADNFWSHEVEFKVGVHARVFTGWGYEFAGSATLGHLFNKDYIFENDEANFHFQLSVRRMLGTYR